VVLISGKISTTIRELQVYPGVINEHYTGEIKTMTQAPGVFVAVSPQIKIAQLVILSNEKKDKVLTHSLQRAGGFGSSNHAYWVQQARKDRPEMSLFLNENGFGDFWILVLMSLLLLLNIGQKVALPTLYCCSARGRGYS
jgi:hypothetical protein